MQDKTPQYIKLDERNHVEKPLLGQLATDIGVPETLSQNL